MNEQDREEDYFFISHSSKDIKKVRIIRNIIENQDKNPILFYLRCITNDDELDELLKREIRARQWFIYCDSKNAKESKWVASERNYIKELNDSKQYNIKISLTINLDKFDYNQLGIQKLEEETLRQINKRIPSIIYWNVDKEYSDAFEKSLKEASFNYNYNVSLNGKLKGNSNPQYIVLCMQAKETDFGLTLCEYEKDYLEITKKLSSYNVPIISNILYKANNGIIYSEFKIGESVLEKATNNINRVSTKNPSDNKRFTPDDVNDLEMLLRVYDSWTKNK